MLLFEPSPGVLVDRITILRLKAEKRGVKTPGMAMEINRCMEEVLRQAQALPIDQQMRFYDLAVDLAIRNGKQWVLEDAVREALKAGDRDRVFEVEQQNAAGNEERALLTKRIDELFGIEPEFKRYAGGGK